MGGTVAHEHRILARNDMPRMSHFTSGGAARMLRGLREGDQRTLLLGAAMLGWNWWRSSRVPEKTLLRRMTLKPGQSMVIRNGDGEPLRIEAG